MESFDYSKIQSLNDFFDNISKIESNYKVVAGGTDLLVKMRTNSVCANFILDIREIPDLVGIREELNYIRIGACTTICDIAESELVKKCIPSLSTAASLLGSPQIRNRATIGGNIITASPAADTIPPLLAANSKIRIKGKDYEKEIFLEEFIEGPGKTKIERKEILTDILIPRQTKYMYSAFIKVGRRKALACSVVNMAGWMKLKTSGKIEDLRIVLGAVGPTAIRAKKAEEYLKKEQYSIKEIRQAAKIASLECSPIKDIRSTVEGRRLLIEGWTVRLLEKLFEKKKI